MSTPLEQAIISAHGTGDWVKPQDVVETLRVSNAIPSGTGASVIHRIIKNLVEQGVLERKTDGSQSYHRFASDTRQLAHL